MLFHSELFFINLNVRCIEISHFDLCHGSFFLLSYNRDEQSIKHICKLLYLYLTAILKRRSGRDSTHYLEMNDAISYRWGD